MSRFFHNIAPTACSAALLALASACTFDDSLCVEDRPTYQEGNDLWLSVDVRSLSPNAGRDARASRADDAGHPDEAGNNDENYIDIENLKVLLVGPNGRVMRVLERRDYTVLSTDDTDNYTTYTLAFNINREYFATDITDPTFKLMVVANAQGPNANSEIRGQKFTMADTWAKTPKEVANMLTTFDYTPGGSWAENVAWMPSIRNNRHIPMTGIVTKSYSTAALDAATKEQPLDAGTINMQRAMAKVRFIDAIQDEEGMDGISITGVRLVGYATQGTYFPEYEYNEKWYTLGACPLETATMREEWYKSSPLLTSPIKFIEPNGSDQKEHNAFIGYMPEFDGSVFIPDVAQYPYLEIDITGIDGTGSNTTFKYGIAGLDKYFVRNHIYEYTIKLDPNLKLTLDVEVNDWVSNEFEYDLSDVVSFDEGNNLQWITDGTLFSTGEKTYNGKQEMQLTIGDAGTDDKAVKGTFKLASPRGGTWTAYFIPGENGSGAFEFVDVDANGKIVEGSGKPAASGKVGEAATIYLHAANSANAFNHYAELVIEVRTVDGRVQYAPIGLSNRYIIFRQKVQ